MRKKVLAGNWKMNLNSNQSSVLFSEITSSFIDNSYLKIIVFPPFLYTKDLLSIDSNVSIGVQNFHPESNGAYTGEVSVSQIKDIGVTHTLVGHSERRTLFNESDDFLKQKVDAALKNNIEVIFCCGESIEIRESANPEDFVTKQLHSSLFHLSKEEIQKCMIAYEPIWAIGTGKVANEDQISKMHTAIRNEIKSKYDEETANQISILYGGSCKPSNAKAIFSCENVDGGLIGGASLDSNSFVELSNCF
ncbi:MAG: triose-phosphate isomerase [Crocinitomicaceae bacterium]|nr:triose-phosphate isomerase [Crocinitomicaceae bacterium]